MSIRYKERFNRKHPEETVTRRWLSLGFSRMRLDDHFGELRAVLSVHRARPTALLPLSRDDPERIRARPRPSHRRRGQQQVPSRRSTISEGAGVASTASRMPSAIRVQPSAWCRRSVCRTTGPPAGITPQVGWLPPSCAPNAYFRATHSCSGKTRSNQCQQERCLYVFLDRNQP